MSDSGVAHKVRDYLAELPRASRETLFAGLERARLKGTIDPIGLFLIEELRRVVAALGEEAPRVPSASRLFFVPAEQFLVDEDLPVKVPGRILRSSLQRIWTWIEHDAAKSEVEAFVAAVQSVPGASPRSADELEALSDPYRKVIAGRIWQTIAHVEGVPDQHRRLVARVGGPRVFQDLQDVVVLLEHHARMTEILAETPDPIDTDDAAHAAAVKAGLANAAAIGPTLTGLVAIRLRERLAPTDLAALAVACVGSDEVKVVAAAPGGALVELMLAEIDWAVQHTVRGLQDPRLAGVAHHLRDYHGLSRQLRAALDLDTVASDWARRLTDARTRLSTELARQLNDLLPTLRGAVRTARAASKHGLRHDPHEADRAVALMEVLDAARLALGELALNQLVTRTHADAVAYLDQTTAGLTEELRGPVDQRRDFLVANAATAVRLHSILHGMAQATLVRRSFEAAAGAALPEVRAAVA